MCKSPRSHSPLPSPMLPSRETGGVQVTSRSEKAIGASSRPTAAIRHSPAVLDTSEIAGPANSFPEGCHDHVSFVSFCCSYYKACAAPLASGRRPKKQSRQLRRLLSNHRINCLHAAHSQTPPVRLLSCFRPCAAASIASARLAVRAGCSNPGCRRYRR
ncbi:hypothetical protein P171DRAFT_54545 [Karstenula rhodostoma CBS 690.94]|uniref:Uncharacterized protein n=1 Tax=Karstenula rhodostoma CBS 690.94 TaxID=1392251 RepID=A0A9P4U940_9PLEO|nr:hypothetical protein P171DRAFT_54545 [Karstenula rhodostoma CBS 690.94]